MNLNDFTQYFDNPAVSVFNRSQSKRLPINMGPLYPLRWDLLSFGNSSKGNSAHSLRMNPMVVPTYTNIKFSEHTAIVPLRTIISDYEERFNYAKNVEGSSLPHLTYNQYITVIRAMLSAGVSPVGSLLDYFGLPVYGDLFKVLDFSSFRMTYEDRNLSIFDFPNIDFFLDGGLPTSVLIDSGFNYRNSSYFIPIVPFIFFLEMKRTSLSVEDYYDIWVDDRGTWLSLFYSDLPENFTSDDVINASSFSTMQSAVEAYQNYIFGEALRVYLNSNSGSSVDDANITTLPLRAYWRFHYDWNTNGNFTNREILLEEDVYGFETKLAGMASAILNGGVGQFIIDKFISLLTPANRLWNDDFFTSLLPTSAVDNAVEIPANSTVLDLAKLTAWQKFVMKLSYSSRYRDVVWNIFKIKPSDARLQQSYPIARKHHYIGIGETLQTSSDSSAGVLGGFAGRGYGSGKSSGHHIFCEEPCVILDFVSMIPDAVYADALHPLVHVDDILDFPIPDMDVLGNQPITADLLSGNVEDRDVVLGYGRQYQEWLLQYNTVHGDYKTSLDYWVLSRRFTDTPVINDDFLRIHPADDFDKIFSVPGAPHANLDIFYNNRVTRHVHRNVRIKI